MGNEASKQHAARGPGQAFCRQGENRFSHKMQGWASGFAHLVGLVDVLLFNYPHVVVVY